MTVNTIKAYSGYVGINMYSASNYVTVNNSESYDNSSYGIYLYNSMSYGKINNCSVHNNSDYGIVFNLAANS
ncbi:MAG: right-handed parallel beta-helix repeat-containing protein [bacterium]